MHNSKLDLLCPCGTQFLPTKTFEAHRAKGKLSCRVGHVIDDLATVLQHSFPSGAALSPPTLDAYDGDLKHKQDLRSYGLIPSDPLFLDLIENKNQGNYLKLYYPDLVPAGSPGSHPRFYIRGAVRHRHRLPRKLHTES